MTFSAYKISVSKCTDAALYCSMSRFNRLLPMIRSVPGFFCLALVLCLSVLPVHAQNSSLIKVDEDKTAEHWQPPDLTNLSLDWWQQFEAPTPGIFQERANQFIAAANEKILDLEADDLLAGENLLSSLHAQIDLLRVAMQEPVSEAFEPISTKDTYTLDELLLLRAQWRNLENKQKVPMLRLDELERQTALLEQRRDNLLRQYRAADIGTPDRILVGLQRVSARFEYELAVKRFENMEKGLAELRQQSELLDQQLEFAKSRLEPGETDWHAVEAQAVEAHEQVAAISKKMSSLQQQMLDTLLADVSKPSLQLLRKQQLTRASAERSLAIMQENLHQVRANWYRFRSGDMDFRFDIQESIQKSEDLVNETNEQIEVWISASQTTVISPPSADGLNAAKNVELAHSAAQETLSLIEDIRASSDDLLLVQEILTADMVSEQPGFRGLWTRLTLITGGVWMALDKVLDFNLFHIGDAPVTPGGIMKMLLILVLGFALSWFIRHLLERLKNRQQFAKSPAVYTLGRILHYIIILVAVLAALGSIGLDFTNFALIAGALSVGIGFGLQSIVNNFVSGLILLFEGSLRVGDYIELQSGVRGIVKEINTRATVINTNDSVDIVVPNSEFITSQLTNWTLRKPIARIRIAFGTAYGSDKDIVRQAAMEAASKVPFILHNMPGYEPEVQLVNFGDSSLDFQLLAWVSKSGVRRPERVRAEFYWELETRLREHGIEIPFPQRDLHLRSGFRAPDTHLLEPDSSEDGEAVLAPQSRSEPGETLK